jgi:hypothetical protein
VVEAFFAILPLLSPSQRDRVEPAARRRAAREESRERRTPLRAAAARPRQPFNCCSFSSFLPMWFDAQRGGQLTQEQPRSSSRRTVERSVDERAQRRDRGAVGTRRRGRALESGSAHCGRKLSRAESGGLDSVSSLHGSACCAVFADVGCVNGGTSGRTT